MRRAPAVKPFLVRLSPELHEGMRVAAIHERRTFADILRGAVEALHAKGGTVARKAPAGKGRKMA